MNSKLLFWSITSALAGFLFGFDTVVISGAEKTIQKLWELDDTIHGLTISAALWGTVLGSIFGGFPTEKFGRRSTLISIGGLYFLSAIWSALAPGVYSLMIARFIGGVGVGISTVAAPLYISEISPANDRGKLAGMFQFNIVFGILVAYVSNAIIQYLVTSEMAWRWMLGAEAIPAIIYTGFCFLIPESPRWLIANKGDSENGKRILELANPSSSPADIDAILNKISQESVGLKVAAEKGNSPKFWSKRMKVPILLAFLIAFFNQLSGINAILYFAPRIFEKTGMGENAAMLQSIGIGITNLIFTFIGLWLIDRTGRKTLLLIGSYGYIFSLGACAIAFYTEAYSIVPACIFLFIGAHAVGQGAVIWVFVSEIFSNQHRAYGQSLGSCTHWVFAASLTLVFPIAAERFNTGHIFSFFCFMMLLQLLWVLKMVPETKGISLEDIEKQLGIPE